jgi:hypothetical protein
MMNDPTEQAQSGYSIPEHSRDGYSQGSHGYKSDGYGEQTGLGAGNNPWQMDHVSDGYRENVFEVNFTDSPYTESFNDPNPRIGGFESTRSGSQAQRANDENAYSTDDELEL